MRGRKSCVSKTLASTNQNHDPSWLWLVISMEFLWLFPRPHSTPKAVSGVTVKFQLFPQAFSLSIITIILIITLSKRFFTCSGKDIQSRKSFIAIFVFAETCSLFWELFVKDGSISFKWTWAYHGLPFNPQWRQISCTFLS